MRTTTLAGLSLLASIALIAACKEGGPPASGPVTTTANLGVDGGEAGAALDAAPIPAAPGAPTAPATASDAAPADFYACAADTDCVAVPKVGCCNNGYKEAVNKSSADAYKASFTCPTPNQICPHYMINDQRVPECNKTTKKCEMVKK